MPSPNSPCTGWRRGTQVLGRRDYGVTKESRNKALTPVLGSRKGSQRSDLRVEILPPRESALKWGRGGRGEPGSTPSGHSGEIAFSCAPAADSAPASGGPSELQAAVQQSPYVAPISLTPPTFWPVPPSPPRPHPPTCISFSVSALFSKGLILK